MKKSVNSNIYGYALDSTWECYGDFLSGAHQAVVCIVCRGDLGAQARNAFEKSFEKLGYGEDACAFLVISASAGASDELRLGAQDAFSIIEGLDPLVVVAADSDAGALLEEAYRTRLDAKGTLHLLGRKAVAFSSFESMLSSPSEKQHAWATLKRFARKNFH